MKSKETSTAPVPTPEDLAEIARNILKRPDGAADLARAFAGLVLGLGGWPLLDERRITPEELPGARARGESVFAVPHDAEDESPAAVKARMRAAREVVRDSISAVYEEMDDQLVDRHEPIPDWERWTITLKNQLHGFFRRLDKAHGRLPPERRSGLPNDVLFDVLLVVEPEILTAKLQVKAARAHQQHHAEVVDALRSWQLDKLDRLDRHLRLIAKEMWTRTPKNGPFTPQDRRPSAELADRLVGELFSRSSETIRRYAREAGGARLP